MAKSVKTYLFFYDERRNFSEDVKKRFSDKSKYTVAVFNNIDEFLKELRAQKEHKFCKVALLGLLDEKENFETIDHLTVEIKKIDGSTGIILLCPQDKLDEIKKTVKFNVDSYVPRNANQALRIHNTVKKLISEHNLVIYRRRRNFSFWFLLAFIGVAIILAVIAWFKFPHYF